MGFNLKLFFEELEEMIKNTTSHVELLEYIEQMKQYAKDYNQL